MPPYEPLQFQQLKPQPCSLCLHVSWNVLAELWPRAPIRGFLPGNDKRPFLILKFCNSFSASALISDYRQPLETNIRHRFLLCIHFVVLHSFPSHTVQILKESAAGSRSLELQPRSQVHPVLLLQEYCPVHHRGKTHTEALSTEGRAKSQMWMHSFEICFSKMQMAQLREGKDSLLEFPCLYFCWLAPHRTCQAVQLLDEGLSLDTLGRIYTRERSQTYTLCSVINRKSAFSPVQSSEY